MQLQFDLEIFLLIFGLMFLIGSFNKIIYLIFNQKNNFIKSTATSLTVLFCGFLIVFFSYYYKENVSKEIRTLGYLLFFISFIKILDKSLTNKNTLKFTKAPKIIHDIILFLIYLFSGFTILKAQMGIDLTPIITTSAVVSMVIGLALQDTLTNFIAGLMLHVEKPFKILDWVFINNIEGKVVEINWRTTKVLTFNNDFFVIPNNSIIKNEMTNYNYPTPDHILVLNIGVGYDSPPNYVKTNILDIINNTENILKHRKNVIRVTSYNDFSINYEIRVWIKDYSLKKNIEDELFTKIWYAFQRNKIKIPFPIRDIYHHYPEKTNTKTNTKTDLSEIKYKLISQIDFFSCVEELDIKDISVKSHIMKYGQNEFLFNQDDIGASFFIIISGQVQIIIDNKKVAILNNGDFFGERSLLMGQKRNASVKVLEDSEFLEITKKTFSEILNKNPELTKKISEIISKRELLNIKNKEKYDKINSKHQVNTKSEENAKTILGSITNFFNL